MFSPPLKLKISTTTKNVLKNKNFFRIKLFHMETKLCNKCFVHDSSLRNFRTESNHYKHTNYESKWHSKNVSLADFFFYDEFESLYINITAQTLKFKFFSQSFQACVKDG